MLQNFEYDAVIPESNGILEELPRRHEIDYNSIGDGVGGISHSYSYSESEGIQGEIGISFIPKVQGNKFQFHADPPNILRQIKRKLDRKFTQKGINIQSSRISMKTTGDIDYIAQYEKQHTYGIAIGVIIKTIIRIIIQVIKAIIKWIVQAVKQLIAYLKSLLLLAIANILDNMRQQALAMAKHKMVVDSEGNIQGESGDEGNSDSTETPHSFPMSVFPVLVGAGLLALKALSVI